MIGPRGNLPEPGPGFAGEPHGVIDGVPTDDDVLGETIRSVTPDGSGTPGRQTSPIFDRQLGGRPVAYREPRGQQTRTTTVRRRGVRPTRLFAQR